MSDETFESAAGVPDEARCKTIATPEALGRAPEAADRDEIQAAITRLERIEAEAVAEERTVAGRAIKV